ncbi:MAG: NINE protein [Faecousia sp.]
MDNPQTTPYQSQTPIQNSTENTRFCKFCGGKIPADAVICTLCGRQVEELRQAAQPNVIINNTNTNVNRNQNCTGDRGREKNKWLAFFLCFFLGGSGAHKFYEGKIGMGLLYLFTCGLFGIGWLIDCIRLLCKPNPYYV